MAHKISTAEPTASPDMFTEPVLLLLRRLERAELIIDRLVERGVISDEEMQYASLRSTLNHAERIIRVREKTQRPAEDVRQAADTIRREVEEIESRLPKAV